MNDIILPTVIFELANSHGGNPKKLTELLESFGNIEYPNKAVKFQVFKADTIALQDYDWYQVYQRLELPEHEWVRLIKTAAGHGEVWIDVFDTYSIFILKNNLSLVSGIKLQASVLENNEVWDALTRVDIFNLSVILNVSGFDVSAIKKILSRFGSLSNNIILQIGFQSYPTAIEDTGLHKVNLLRSTFPGYSISVADHADAKEDFAELVPLYSYVLGCSYIEKHFCLSRDDAEFDAFSAIEPEQMQILCNRIKELSISLSGQFICAEEASYLKKTVQIPLPRREIKMGTRVRPEDVYYRRTSQSGLPWGDIEGLQQRRKLLALDKERNKAFQLSDFRDTKIGAIVACRMKSSRLKRKALLPIAGMPSVERCLRQCLAIPSVETVVLATSTLEEDSILRQFTCEGRVKFWAGDPDDVISRYLGACKEYSIDVIVRVTADCPLVSPAIIETLLASHFSTGADYTTSARCSVGLSAEIINVNALQLIIERVGKAEYSEYMTWYFKNNPHLFHLNVIELPEKYVRDYRLTLDYQEDLELFERIFQCLSPGREHYDVDEVYRVLDETPSLSSINAHLDLSYRSDEALISMLNEKTYIT